MPPAWLAMFISPESEPEDLPPRSAETAQNALCERYSEPAPPARTTLAKRVFSVPDPNTMKTAVSAQPETAMLQRPIGEPKLLVTTSPTAPASMLQMGI